MPRAVTIVPSASALRRRASRARSDFGAGMLASRVRTLICHRPYLQRCRIAGCASEWLMPLEREGRRHTALDYSAE